MTERVAIPIWQGRISPVLDTAARLWVCDLGAGSEAASHVVEIQQVDIGLRAELIRKLGVSTLLCGAVSRPLHTLLVGAGITVRPWLTGAVHEVLAAYSESRLDSARFQLPGCGCRRQGGRAMQHHGNGNRKR